MKLLFLKLQGSRLTSMSKASGRLLFALILAFFCFSKIAHAHDKGDALVSVNELVLGVEKGLYRVSEFRYLRKLAEKIGLKVFLIGDTAAVYINYVRHDLSISSTEGHRFSQFDYDSTEIFKPDSILYLSIDGTEQQINEFRSAFAAKYPYPFGNKKTRLLIAKFDELKNRGGIDAWQSSDAEELKVGIDELKTNSSSEAMIEISPTHLPVIRSMRNPTQPDFDFMEETARGAIHFYGLQHAGKNLPEAVSNFNSVLSALVQSSRNNLSFDQSSIQLIEKISKSVDPHELTQNQISKLHQTFSDIVQFKTKPGDAFDLMRGGTALALTLNRLLNDSPTVARDYILAFQDQ